MADVTDDVAYWGTAGVWLAAGALAAWVTGSPWSVFAAGLIVHVWALVRHVRRRRAARRESV